MKRLIATLMTSLLITGTAFAQTDDHAKLKKGAIIGSVAGGVLGAVLGNNGSHHSAKRGAAVGVLTGGAAGAIIGAMMDKQERELRQIPGVNVSRTANNELNVSVKNEVLFDFNSASLRSGSRRSLADMADVFNRYSNTRISVEGHTDSVGSASYNERLSERRADNVANYLGNLGVRGSRIDAVGYGESQPRSSNNSANGRQMNRRVEIHVLATNA
ncbi:MAG: cell envelope biosis protein OmpA [Acidobacteria bacterium]|jgi:outer membrane protein OmpA-like peptidoglycan-associated protein|nr:cell envelope biosis protein OmpA [Acidobacteriota bacterium]